MTEPHDVTALEARNAIAAGELSTVELVESCLDQIAKREATVQAWQYLDPDRARRHAAISEERSTGGALDGIPIGIKDVIDTADMPTAKGSAIYVGRQPNVDAACVRALRRAGAIILGKTVTTEFAYFHPGPTRNPRDVTRTPGGSSSGSAAAVGDYMVPVALGTQTAGSVTRPASYCGVASYVCSHGELCLDGIQELSPSLDSLGILARSVTDLHLVRCALKDQSPSAFPTISPLKVGIVWPDALTYIDGSMRAQVAVVVDVLTALGAMVLELELSDILVRLAEAHQIIMEYEAARSLAEEQRFEHLLSESIREMLERGRSTPGAVYGRAKEVAGFEAMKLKDLQGGIDVILTPAATGPAPVGSNTGSPILSRPWQVAGLPVVGVPAGVDSEGMPLGIQLVGAAGGDDRLLAIAHTVECALTFAPHAGT